ncbi:MAG TPA: tetratricopeptide repeat protein [Verrucomicrobiales bacterium]|nr:tetratricopeptide repeat protein [Verrucomicrobiales bacterium]
MPCTAQEPNAKAARFLEALTRRPSSGPAFDRMVDAWLETESLESLEKYLAARTAAPDAAPRLLLGLFHSRSGNDASALAQFSQATAANPQNASAWLLRGQTEARLRESSAALKSLEKARAAAPPGSDLAVEAAQSLGRALLHAGRPEDALRVWNELIAQKPDDLLLREDVLELLISENQFPAALSAAAELVARTADPPRRIRYQLRTGDIHALAGDQKHALETYAACLADTGGDSWLEREILAQIERIFRRDQNLPGLRAWYENRLAAAPRHPGLLRALARLLAETGQKDEALKTGETLLAITPGDRDARGEFIALLITAGRQQEAINQLTRLLEQYPGDRELRTQLAGLKHKAGDTAGCLATLKGFPQADESARLQLASLYGQFGFHDEAVGLLQQALKDFPSSTAARPALAPALLRSGKKDEALTEWNALANAAPAASDLLQLSRQIAAAGLPEEAFAILAKQAERTGNDPQVLNEIGSLALRTRQFDAALPFMLALLRKADTAAALNVVMDQVPRMIRLSSQMDKVMAELRASKLRQDQCLLAALLQGRGDTAGAEAILAKTDPAFAAGQMVGMYQRRGEWYKAAEAEQALFNAPGGHTAARAQSLSSLWMRAGDIEKALLAAEEWQRLSPASASAILTRADLLSRSGQHTDALRMLRAAIPRMDGNAEVRARLAETCRLAGENAEAMRLYRGLYDSTADIESRQQWLQAWAATAVDAGTLRNVIAEFTERHRLAPEAIEPLLALAELHRTAGDYESRRQFLTEAARLKQDDPAIAIEIAALYERENQPAAAIEALRKALPLDKTGRARSRLARLLLAFGNKDEGLRLLQEDHTSNDPAKVESTARMLAREGRAADALAFLDLHSAGDAADYRLRFLRGLLLLHTRDFASAAATFSTLVHSQDELPDSRRQPLIAFAASRLTSENEGNASLHSLMPKDAAALFLTLSIRAALEKKDDPKALLTAELPQSVNEMHAAAAAAALLTAARDPDESNRNAILDDLTAQGLAWARLAMKIPQTDPFNDDTESGLWNRLTEENPNDLTLLACAAAADGLSWSREANPALARRAWETFHRTHPDFALLVSIAVFAEKGGPQPWENDVLAAALKVERPSGLLLMAGMRAQHGSTKSIPPARATLRHTFAKQMAAWYQRTEFRGLFLTDIKRMAFLSVVSGLFDARDHASLAAHLEREMAMLPASPRIYLPQGIAAPLGFLPEQLPGVPGQIMEMTSGVEQYFGDTDEPLTPEFLHLAGGHVKNPLLRALLECSSSNPEIQRKALTGLTASDPRSVATLVLTGAWAAEQNRPEDAVKAFAEVLTLPLLSPQYRRRIDSAILALGTGNAPEPVKESAKAAALRLRRENLTERQRLDLAKYMKILGLTREAESLLKAN